MYRFGEGGTGDPEKGDRPLLYIASKRWNTEGRWLETDRERGCWKQAEILCPHDQLRERTLH